MRQGIGKADEKIEDIVRFGEGSVDSVVANERLDVQESRICLDIL